MPMSSKKSGVPVDLRGREIQIENAESAGALREVQELRGAVQAPLSAVLRTETQGTLRTPAAGASSSSAPAAAARAAGPRVERESAIAQGRRHMPPRAIGRPRHRPAAGR